MTRYIGSIIALLLPFITMAADPGFVIKGKVTGIISGYISIVPKTAADGTPEFTPPPKVRIENGQFTYTGKIDRPQIIQLKVSTRTVSVFLENAEYTVECSLDSLTGNRIKGGKLNTQWWDFLRSQEKGIDYLQANPKLEIGAWLAYTYAQKYDQAKMAYHLLTPDGQQSFEGKALREKLNAWEKTAAGTPLPEFKMTDPTGKPVSVKEMHGKVVVLDFWASWCAPCRAYIPTLREHYLKFKDKGVVFVSVSVDDDPSKWMEALNAHKMEWVQVLAAGGFKETGGVRKLFNITGIPYMVVVDKNGKIGASLDYFEKDKVESVVEKLLQ